MSDFRLTPAQDRAMDVLISDAMYIALAGGSRSGKTFLFVRAVILRALKARGSRHAIFRYRFNACKQSVVLETLPRVMALCFPGLMDHCHLDKTDWYLKLPNDAEIWFGGLDDKERVEKILGKEYVTIYFNECSQIPYQSVILALSRLAQKTETLRLKAYFDFNPPSKNHWTYRLFVEKKDPNTKQSLKDPQNYGFFLINPADNRENIAPEYLAILEGMPEKARNRFLLGKFADASEGSLWTDDLLATTRVLNSADVPEFLRVIVAVDPSGCSGEEDLRSDEIGIVVVALGTNGHGYVLEDLSGRYGPTEWGRIVCDAYARHKADRVVGESNYGGAMVEHVVRSVNADIAYQDAKATRGKVVRAEPIAALYEQGKMHHYGYFPEMEDQMCSMTLAGYTGLRSPDRADACLVAGTMVRTLRGLVPIESVTLSDMILTRKGYFPLTWCGQTKKSAKVFDVVMSDGTVVTATSEHPFWVESKGDWVVVDSLVWGDTLLKHSARRESWHRLRFHLTARPTADTLARLIKASSVTTSALLVRGLSRCIETCGKASTALFRKVITSITSTATGSTTASQTFSASHQSSTASRTPTDRLRLSESTLRESGRSPRRGMLLRLVQLGTLRTVKSHGSAECRSLSSLAGLAVSRQSLTDQTPCSALGRVVIGSQTVRTVTTISSLARSARRIFGSANTLLNRSPARVHVVQVLEKTERLPVYNLHLDGPHEFFANDVLVHNCVWGISVLFPAMTVSQTSRDWTPPAIKTVPRLASSYSRRR